MTGPSADASARSIEIPRGDGTPALPALWLRPPEARAVLVLAHGAGAGMRHSFLAAAAGALAAEGVATLRFAFPYMAAGRRFPDRAPVLAAAVRGAVAAARRQAPDLPLVAGGKSMGGRMTAIAQAEAPLEGVRGLVFLGYPLHPAGRPERERSAPLTSVRLPMLFLQGTRDRLAGIDRMRKLCAELDARATLHEVRDADHSFHVPKRTGRSDDEVRGELAGRIGAWIEGLPTPDR